MASDPIRFALGSPTGPRTAVWNLWRHTNPKKSDVFLAPRSLARVVKLSFHESGEIRNAFISDVAFQTHAPGQAGSRARQVWQRNDYAEAGVARLYQICMPHSELRTFPLDERLNAADVIWIPVSESSDATFIEVILTRPGLEKLEIGNFIPVIAGPLAHWILPSGENLIVLARGGTLDEAAVAHIRDAAARIPLTAEQQARLGPSTRLNLTMEPVGGVGAVVEVACPCTIRQTAA